MYQTHTACKQNKFTASFTPKSSCHINQEVLLIACRQLHPCVVVLHRSLCSVVQLDGLSLMQRQNAFRLQLRCMKHSTVMMLQEGMFGLREWEEDEGFIPPTQDANDPSYDPSGSVKKARQPSARVHLSALNYCTLVHNSTCSAFLTCR